MYFHAPILRQNCVGKMIFSYKTENPILSLCPLPHPTSRLGTPFLVIRSDCVGHCCWSIVSMFLCLSVACFFCFRSRAPPNHETPSHKSRWDFFPFRRISANCLLFSWQHWPVLLWPTCGNPAMIQKTSFEFPCALRLWLRPQK